jgi:hypothetical protein
MAAFDGIANLPNPRLGFAALGRLQPKAGPPGPFLRRAIALSPVGLRPRQVARIQARDGSRCRGRVHHQGLQHVLGLTAIVGIGSGYHDPQRHGPRVTG